MTSKGDSLRPFCLLSPAVKCSLSAASESALFPPLRGLSSLEFKHSWHTNPKYNRCPLLNRKMKQIAFGPL